MGRLSHGDAEDPENCTPLMVEWGQGTGSAGSLVYWREVGSRMRHGQAGGYGMNKEPGSEMGVTVCETAFGWVGLAWSGQGLVRTTLPKATEGEAASCLPGASGDEPLAASDTEPLVAAGLDVAVLADKMQRYFEGEAVAFDEALDPSIGTDFQRRVWAITRAIPRGQTRTYGQVARQAGRPVGAARAVGQAMARNPWPVIVPCHRVVGHDGRLTGFGGGVTMKQEMLNMEAEI